MQDIRFSIEGFLYGPAYMSAGGMSGKAVPYDYVRGLAERILAHLAERYPSYEWAVDIDKWETAIVGSLKETPDPTPAVIGEIRDRILEQDRITLEEAAAFNAEED